MSSRAVVVVLLFTLNGCHALLGIDDPIFIDGDIIPGVELSSLELSRGALDRTFDGKQATYLVELQLAVEALELTATVDSGDLTIFLDDEELASGVLSPPIEVDPGSSSLELFVRRESTGEESRYTISFDRQPRVSEILVGPGSFADRFGDAFALDGDLLFVGAPCTNAAARANGGKVYIYQQDEAGAWVQLDELEAPTPADNMFFGASLSHDAGVLAVGADGGARCGVAAGSRVGRAFVFEQAGDSWNGVELAPSVPEPGAEFGAAVSVDGDFIAVGAPRQTSGSRSGSVFLFARNSGWIETSVLASPNDSDMVLFGVELDLNSNVLAVGAPGDAGGAVHVFHNSSGTATPLGIAAPRAQDVSLHGPLGFGQSLSQDDDSIAIGGPLTESGTGAVWIYDLDPLESTITFAAMLTAPDPAEDDHFGASVDIDEDLLVVGAPGEGGLVVDAGAAHLWARADASWQHVARLGSTDEVQGASLGAAIDIDELRVLIGAPGEGNGVAAFLE